MKKLRMGAISFAHPHQYSYVLSMLQSPIIELVAVAESDPDRIKYLKEWNFGAESLPLADRREIGAIKIYEDYQELLKRDDIDGVSICSENVLHFSMAMDAARAGKHVILEKPLTLSLSDSEEIVSRFQENQLYLSTAYPVRFDPASQRVKRRVESGEIGTIVSMSATNHLGAGLKGWFIDPKLSGGGCIMDHVVHSVDLFRWFTGMELIEVYAEAENRIQDIPVEDVGMLAVTFENGMTGSIDPSWDRPKNWSRWGDVTLRILGTKGVIEYDITRQSIVKTINEKPNTQFVFFNESMDYYLIRHFARSILEGKEPSVTGRDGRAGVAAIKASYDSIHLHKPISIKTYSN